MLSQFFTEVQQEDFELCEKTQVNLNAGVYSTGTRMALLPLRFRVSTELSVFVVHPSEERGVLYYQQEVVRTSSIRIPCLCAYH